MNAYGSYSGYTIPLDKRLAADGRGLQSTHINENFAKLSEALYIADRKAREAVEMRSQVEKKIANKEKVRLKINFWYIFKLGRERKRAAWACKGCSSKAERSGKKSEERRRRRSARAWRNQKTTTRAAKTRAQYCPGGAWQTVRYKNLPLTNFFCVEKSYARLRIEISQSKLRSDCLPKNLAGMLSSIKDCLEQAREWTLDLTVS